MNNAHTIIDITNTIKEIISNKNGFPKDVKILRANLELDGLHVYRVNVDYEIGDAEFTISERVYGDISGAVNSVLGHIKEFYDTLHQFKGT